MTKKLILLLTAILLASCSDKKTEEVQSVEEAINKYQSIWLSNDLRDYVFTFQRAFLDCPAADNVPAIEIHVEDNQVVAAYIAVTGKEIVAENEPTIDDVFYLMKLELLKNPMRFSATNEDLSLPKFNRQVGYPLTFYVDESENECDATQYQIYDFN